MLVDDGRADRGGAAARRAGDADQAGPGLHQDVLAGLQRHRTGRAEAGGRCEDDVGVDRAEFRLAEAELAEDAGAEILHHHVGAGDQPTGDLTAFLALQVDADRALVAVGAEIEAADPLAEDVGAGPAPFMRAIDRLDLDHVGAHVGQILRARRTLQEVAKADDANSVEQHFPIPERSLERLQTLV